MTSLVPHVFPDTGHQVRSVVIDDAPHWVAADVCAVLDIANVTRALASLDDDEKGLHSMKTPGGEQLLNVVSEAGLYSLILRSRKPQAKAFKRWVTHEVLPAIRKTGRYEVTPRVPQSFAEALELAARQARELETAERRVAQLEPVAQAYDVLASARGDFSLRHAAFILNRDPGISTGQNRLLAKLRGFDMVDRKGVPYAKHAAHLTERIRTYEHPATGEPTLGRPQIRVTVAGLRYLHKRMGGTAPLRFDQLPLDDAA